MPTLISELTPLQSQWLYEHQLTRGDSYEEKWHRFEPSPFDTTIFRSKPQKRKLPYDDDEEEDNAAAKSMRPNSPRPMAQQHQHQQQQHQRHHAMPKPAGASHGPRFPHMGEKLTWAQSRENLKGYYDHYGNCNVPQKYKDNPKLGRWVNKQRKKKKNPSKYGALTKEQILDLESLGFVWNN